MSLYYSYVKLYEAALTGNVEKLHEAFRFLTVEDIINTRLSGEKTALRIASQYTCIHAVDYLLRRFEEWKNIHPLRTYRPSVDDLFYAECLNGNVEMVEYYLENWSGHLSADLFGAKISDLFWTGNFRIVSLFYTKFASQLPEHDLYYLGSLNYEDFQYCHNDFLKIGEKFVQAPYFRWVADMPPLRKAIFFKDLNEIDRQIKIIGDASWMAPYARDGDCLSSEQFDVFAYASKIGDPYFLGQLLRRAVPFFWEISNILEIAERCCDHAARAGKVNVIKYLLYHELIRPTYSSRWRQRLLHVSSIVFVVDFFQFQIPFDDRLTILKRLSGARARRHSGEVSVKWLFDKLDMRKMKMKLGTDEILQAFKIQSPEEIDCLCQFFDIGDLYKSLKPVWGSLPVTCQERIMTFMPKTWQPYGSQVHLYPVLHIVRKWPFFWNFMATAIDNGWRCPNDRILDHIPYRQGGETVFPTIAKYVKMTETGMTGWEFMKAMRLLAGCARLWWPDLKVLFESMILTPKNEKGIMLNMMYLFGVGVYGVNRTIQNPDSTNDSTQVAPSRSGIVAPRVYDLQELCRRKIRIAIRRNALIPMSNRDRVLTLEEQMPKLSLRYLLYNELFEDKVLVEELSSIEFKPNSPPRGKEEMTPRPLMYSMRPKTLKTDLLTSLDGYGD